ncbi:hypothetical protein KQI84_03095 [bacterium]|nr:hypothetical protein [bacterium]
MPISTVEPQPVVGALRVARGEVLYWDYTAGPPVIPLTYGALTYLLPGYVSRIVGITNPQGVLLVGRWLTFLAGLCALGFAVLLAHQRKVPWKFALWVAVPLYTFPYAAEWLVKFTPDSFALAASLGGWALVGPPDRDEDRAFYLRLVGAIILWIAVAHLKMIVLIGPIGFAVESIVAARRRSVRSLVPLAAAGAAVVLGVVLSAVAANALTDGMWKLHVIDSVKGCAFNLRFALTSLLAFGPPELFGRGATPLLGGAAVFLAMMFWAGLGVRRQPLYAVPLALFLVNVAFMAKQGANMNYLLGAIVAWSIAAVVDLANREPKGLRRIEVAVSICGLALVALNLPAAPRVSRELTPATEEEYRRADIYRERFGDDRVLVAESVYGITRDAPIPWADNYHASLLLEDGSHALDPVLDKIKAGEYDVVITGPVVRGTYHRIPVYPQAIFDALSQSYAKMPLDPSEARILSFWIPLRAVEGASSPQRVPAQ